MAQILKQRAQALGHGVHLVARLARRCLRIDMVRLPHRPIPIPRSESEQTFAHRTCDALARR
jgi:hypothetical protein